jgi:hypothetical protein
MWSNLQLLALIHCCCDGQHTGKLLPKYKILGLAQGLGRAGLGDAEFGGVKATEL